MSKSSTARPSVRTILLCATVGALVQLGLLWGTSLPLGVPKEWTWARVEFSFGDVFNLWPAVVTGLMLIGYVHWGSTKIRTSSKAGRAAFLLLLWAMGLFWTLSEVAAVPGIAGLNRAPFVLYYTRSSGYFTQAREDARDLKQFLATYHERIQDSSLAENYLHMGTHPPGLTTAFVAILNGCEKFPALRQAVLATQPGSIRDSFAVIAQNLSPEARTTWESDSAAIWLATLIVILLETGTCIPLYLLARRTVSPEGAWWAAAFWLLVPAAAIFFPKSDVLFPCLAMWIQWLWLIGIDRRSVWVGAAAGAAIFVAVCLTLAFAPLGLMLVLQGIFVVPSKDQRATSLQSQAPKFDLGRLNVYLGSGVVFGLLILAARLLGGINLLQVWMQNLRNHASFYDHATRSYLPWLVVNPLELGIALGLPLAVLSGAGIWILLKHVRPLRWDVLIPVGVWAILWLSGKNMGEAARLWVFLMPYAVWTAAISIDRFAEENRQSRPLLVLLMVQMVVCLGTVMRIDGFHFAELLP
ncbi:hypothetical protein SH661x_000341 [Planctomicrobium sp. SH661]|uniref:hypothetical protein n=1 Tax=Planctomicrobium sp. SH661 TaxID=3448124 RepID=UPI003F5B4058